MAQYFFECHLIPEPKLSLLAKACLNIMAHKYAKLEEDALARYVQRNLEEARGPHYVTVPQIQREVGVRNGVAKTTRDLIPPRLRRDPPLDPIREPEWAQGW
jgi:hypothetical protein